jgi:hypothetical protein
VTDSRPLFSQCPRPVDRDGGDSTPVGETSALHAGGLDVRRCGRPNCRMSAAANERSQKTVYSNPVENNRIFLNFRLCDGPPRARYTSLRRHPVKRPCAANHAPLPACEPACVAHVVGLSRSPSPGTPARLAKPPSDDSRHGTHANSTAAMGDTERNVQSHPFSRQILCRGA